MNMREAIDSWMEHDGWQFADREAAWKYMFEAGYAAAIEAVKAGGAYDCAKGDEFSCACSMYKLYKLPEQPS